MRSLTSTCELLAHGDQLYMQIYHTCPTSRTQLVFMIDQ
ncbi:hypothetical protein PATA110616_22160 [Paenibacillus tarimensis]